MNYYFAPLEGITGYIYRNAHRKYYKGVDRYYAPFITPNLSKNMMTKELKDLLPENNQGLTLIPQILTNNAEGFLVTAQKLKDLGYTEVNLNLGCPSGTVTGKGRGAGFLKDCYELDLFFYKIFSQCDMEISVKTRLGMDDPEDFYELMEVYNRFPIKELIIHPRVREDFYKYPVRKEFFDYGFTHSKNPVCYNGDIFTVKGCVELKNTYPDLPSVMFGRGLLMDPELCDRTKENRSDDAPDFKKFKEFHQELLESYKDYMSGGKNVLFKMKELWFYMIAMFPDQEKNMKKIKKAQKLADFEAAVRAIFEAAEI